MRLQFRVEYHSNQHLQQENGEECWNCLHQNEL
jgi:hypothetical protein